MTDSLTRELLAVRERAQERRTEPRRSSRERDIRELVHLLATELDWDAPDYRTEGAE